jgi:PrcB C-terminal
MMFHRSGVLIPVLILAGCGGSTMRVAKDDPADGSGPVSLAPAPDPVPDSTAAPRGAGEKPAPPAPPTMQRDSTTPSPTQGYAPYGAGAPALELRRIGQWTNTGISESRRLVIRNANAWAQFWAELGVGDRPNIDFTKYLVVAVAAGQRSSGGYEISIQRVSQANGDLTIEVLQTVPSPNCVTTSALTQPVDVVVVPAVGAQGWSFLERQEVRGCR